MQDLKTKKGIKDKEGFVQMGILARVTMTQMALGF